MSGMDEPTNEPLAEGAAPVSDSAAAPGESPARATAPRRRSRLRWYLAVLLILVVVAALNRRWIAAIPNAQAKACLEARDLDGAAKWLAYSQRIAVRNAETEMLMARLLRKQGQLGMVDTHLENAREWGWDEQRVQHERWLTEAQAGRLREALPHLSEMLQAAGANGREICEAFITGTIKSKNHLRTAHELLTIWLTDHPQDPQPHYLLAKLSLQFQDVTRGEAELRLALQADPAHGAASLALADMLRDRNQIEEALELLAIAAGEPALRTAALLKQAKCLRLAGRAAEAQAVVEQLLAENPDSPAANLELALLELAQNRPPADVLPRLEAAVRRDPRNSAACQALAGLFTQTGNEEAARQLTAMATEFQTQLQRAEELTQQVLRDPGNLTLRFQVGRIHLVYGDVDTGVDWLQGSLDIDPNHRPSLELLANYFDNKPNQTPEEWQLSRKYRRQLTTIP